jgi:Tol biopolymer transport system component
LTFYLKEDDIMKRIKNIFLLLILILSACAPVPKKYTTRIYLIQEITEEGEAETTEKKEKVPAEIEVIEKSSNVKSVTKITNYQKDEMVDNPAISPDGSIIVYGLKEKEGIWNLWGAKTGAGRSVSKLTNGKYYNITPVWAPDGKYIYFASNRLGGPWKIWRIKASGMGGITQITSSETSDVYPHISSDNSLVAYTSKVPHSEIPQIWTINSNGSHMTQLTEGYQPRFSPDGKKILFVIKDKDSESPWLKTFNSHLWIMSANGANPTQITFGDFQDKDPSWSPDGQAIVFASNRGLDENKIRNFDIWYIKADGSNLTQLTTNGSYDAEPCWGPKGKYIYFTSNRGLHWNIWRMEMVTF